MSLYAEDIAALRAAGWRQAAPTIWESADRSRWVDTRERDWRLLFRDAEGRLPSPLGGEGPGVRGA